MTKRWLALCLRDLLGTERHFRIMVPDDPDLEPFRVNITDIAFDSRPTEQES